MDNTASRIRRILAPALIIFIIPALMLAMYKCGKNNYKPLPYIGEKGLSASGDSLYYTVPPFRLTDHTGKAFGSAELKGKIYVVDFFFTRCPNICKTLTADMQKVNDQFKKRDLVHQVSFTIDPRFDTPEVLAAYAKKHGAGDKWHFLTGPRDTMNRIATGMLTTHDPNYPMEPDNILHSGMLILVDGDGHIRGIYDGQLEKEVTRMLEDVHTLALSYERK